MKYILFITFLLIWVWGVVSYVFFSSNYTSASGNSSGPDIESIFGLTGSGNSSDKKFLTFDIAVGDQILMTPDSEIPVRDSTSSGWVSLGKGLYLLALDNAFSDIEITTSLYRISHLAKGVYIINTKSDQNTIYSLTSFLRVKITDTSSSGGIITEFNLLPTQFFRFNAQAPVQEMRGADVFRLAQINTLSTGLPEIATTFKKIFADDSGSAQLLFTIYSDLRKERLTRLTAFSDSFLIKDNSEVSFFEKYWPIFVNPAKKRVLYRNILLKRLQYLYRLALNTCTNVSCTKELKIFESQIAEVSDIIKDLWALSQADEQSARTLAREYSILISFVTPSRDEKYSEAIFSNLETLSNPATVPSNKTGYLPIKNLYTRYIFDWQDETAHAKELQRYVEFIFDKGLLDKRDFLGFIHFFWEALRSEKVTQAPSISLFRLLLKIADSHIKTITDLAQRQTILSIFYYTFSGIADNLQLSLTREFFTRVDLEDTELKSNFLLGANANVDTAITASINWLISQYSTFDSVYWGDFEKNSPMTEGTINSRVLTNNAFKELTQIEKIITNYAGYRTQISLWSSAKQATGLEAIIEPLSLAALTEYLGRFNGVDTSSISIVNDIGTELFYDVRVRISGKNFSFKFSPIGHTIEKVLVEENGVVNTQFERTKQSIDEREKVLRELAANTTNTADKAKYDIRNYFVSTFSENASPVSGQTPAQTTPIDSGLSTQMKLFIQSNLIEKDFLLVKESLNIPIQSVYASIEQWAYDIRITNATSNLSDGNVAFTLSIDSKYIFTQDVHAFQDMSFTVKNDQGISLFGGTRIRLLPSTIETRSFNALWKQVVPYLTRLTQLGTSPNSITIDLINKTLIVDSNLINI